MDKIYQLFFKRVFDFLIAFILLVFLFLPFLIIALFIKRDSKGTVFYKQQRIGLNGKEFSIYKFRTMVSNADKIGGYSTGINDSRITGVGNFLRKTSLDELPQLINVLRGEMSFIGPRPDVLQQKKDYSINEFKKRHSVLPGITGLAQCRNRHNASVKSRKMYDLFYSEKISLKLDLLIVFWTIRVLKKGSY
ncbi:sugar transferase [Polaribacter uvawellassae]|uniref:sugar transferase n=1 Tax=Polaribacter uvawellassae TaxID=3133495 RepID=UPI00321978D7